MIRPATASLLVALIVILAGCSTAVPDAPTTGGGSSEPPAPTEYPPGTNSSGIADPATVIETHQTLLANRSYAFLASQGTGNGDSALNVTVRSNLEERRAHVIASGAGRLNGTEVFVTEETVYIKQDEGTSPEYQVRDHEVPFPVQHRRQLGAGYLEAILSAGEYERSGYTTVGTTPVWEFTLSEPRTDQSSFQNVTSIDGSMLIDQQGIVWRASLAVTVEGSDGDAVTTRIEYHVDAVGNVSVAEPTWVAEATAETGNRS